MTNLERVVYTLSAKDIAINLKDFHDNNNCLFAGRVFCAGCPAAKACGHRSMSVKDIIEWLESECDT